MGRINIDISDDLEKQFRLKTVEQFGGKKGDLSKAAQEAIKTWINKAAPPKTQLLNYKKPM